MAQITHKIEISPKSIVLTLLILLGAYVAYFARDIIMFVFIGILIMAAINPLVTKLQSFKLSRGFSIALIYIMVILLLSVAVAAIIPPLVSQVRSLVNQIPIPPNIAESLTSFNLSLQDIQIIADQLNTVPKVLAFVGSAFSGAIVLISLLVFSFYLLIERATLHETLHGLYKNETKAKKAEKFITEAENQIGGWVRAELTLMVIVGLLTYIGLSILGINYALSLAILAGLLEVLPNLGPTISAVPAIIVAWFTASPVMALAVGILYILVQQVENNLIVPMVMRQVVGLSPVITIILLLVGFKVAGVAGAALAIPIFLVGKIIVIELYKLRNQLD